MTLDDPNRYDYHLPMFTPGVGAATTAQMTADEKKQARKRELSRKRSGKRFGFAQALPKDK